MMSCAASVLCIHPILSHYCTEHGQQCGVALLGRITTINISKSGQLGP
jgi:hypothetical protein